MQDVRRTGVGEVEPADVVRTVEDGAKRALSAFLKASEGLPIISIAAVLHCMICTDKMDAHLPRLRHTFERLRDGDGIWRIVLDQHLEQVVLRDSKGDA